MSRFAFLSTMTMPWGGSEELWAGAAQRLVEAGHSVSASVYGWEQDPSTIQELERKGVALNRRPRRIPWADRVARKTLGIGFEAKTVRWLRRLRPDLVVISQGDALTGVPWMHACHAQGWRYAVISQANWEGFWPDDAVAIEALNGYRNAAKAFFVSRSNLRLLSDQLGGSIPNAEVVSNPFNVSYAPAIPRPASDGVFRLACVARLDPRAKGQDLLLHVLSRDNWRARPVKLRFYGKGSSEHALRRLAAELKLATIFFEGHLDNVESIWADNHALVLPSRFEGTPLALIEAMLCARTAVVTDVGGNAELLEDNVSGFVAKAPTVALLDDAMERLWERRADLDQLGAAARRRVTSCIPEDPIGHFCDRLLTAVEAGR